MSFAVSDVMSARVSEVVSEVVNDVLSEDVNKEVSGYKFPVRIEQPSRWYRHKSGMSLCDKVITLYLRTDRRRLMAQQLSGIAQSARPTLGVTKPPPPCHQR